MFPARPRPSRSWPPRHPGLNPRRIGEAAINLLVEKLNRWDTVADESSALQLVRGDWRDGLSAPGAGKQRGALVLRN